MNTAPLHVPAQVAETFGTLEENEQWRIALNLPVSYTVESVRQVEGKGYELIVSSDEIPHGCIGVIPHYEAENGAIVLEKMEFSIPNGIIRHWYHSSAN